MIVRPMTIVVLISLLHSGSSRLATADDFVRTISVASIGRPVVARTDSVGTIHLVCESDDGPRYARSKDNGATFSDPIPVIQGVSSVEGLEYNVWDMVIGREGRVHVALGTNAWKLKLPQQEWGYFYAILAPASRSFSPVRNLNRKPSEGFSLAADDRGHVTACWLADKLYANVSLDDGTTFGPTTELNSLYNPCNCCTTSVAYGKDGKLAILYREETRNERDMYVISWDQTGGEMTRKRVGSTPWKIDACPMTYFTIASEGPGFVATWPTAGRIYFTRLDRQLEPTGPIEIETPGRSGMRTGMIGLSGTDGKTLVAWKANNRLGWQLYDAAGKPEGSPGSVSSPGTGAAGVASGKGFLLFR